jgi:hypothetical protein
MAEVFYYSYLVVLLALPQLAYWRWGVVASLAVTVAELGAVLLGYFLLGHYELLPPRPPGGPTPQKEVLEHLMRTHAEGFAHTIVTLTIFVAIPWIAALSGGVLSLVWSAVLAIRRSIANRPMEPL